MKGQSTSRLRGCNPETRKDKYIRTASVKHLQLQESPQRLQEHVPIREKVPEEVPEEDEGEDAAADAADAAAAVAKAAANAAANAPLRSALRVHARHRARTCARARVSVRAYASPAHFRVGAPERMCDAVHSRAR